MNCAIRLLPLIVPMLMLGLGGCSDNLPKAVPAKGTIKTTQGEACGGALIVLHPTEKVRVNDPKPVAIADEAGNFVLRTFALEDGAVPGEYGVTVVWPDSNASKSEMSISSEGKSAGPDRLGGRYGNPQSPKIQVTIPASGDASIALQVDG